MMTQRYLALVDGSAEHKQRRAWLYLMACLALCFSLHLQASVDGYLEVTNRALFLCCLAAAALSAAVAVHLRAEVAQTRARSLHGLRPSLLHQGRRQPHPDWALNLTWPAAIREAKLLKLLRRELRPARQDERPVGLMLLGVDPAEDGSATEPIGQERLLGMAAEDLGFYVRRGTLTFRLGHNKLAVLTARLDALSELRELADALEAEMSYHSDAATTPYRLALGIAVSMESRVHSNGLLSKAKAALGQAKALGLTSQILVAD